MLIQKKNLEKFSPTLVFLSLCMSIPVGESASKKSNKKIFYSEKRTSYVECPPELSLLVGTYPLESELCSEKYTYCVGKVAIRGLCPPGLFYNPSYSDCDENDHLDECKEKHLTKHEESFEDGRPIVDEPDYNDCSRKLCDFYPNAEDTKDGNTYLFCDSGIAIIRNCTMGYTFDIRTSDCAPQNQAKKWVTPTVGDGKMEPENSLLAASKQDTNTLPFQDKPLVSALGFERGNRVSIIQDQTPRKGKNIPNDSIWSHWIVCPNATYVTKISKEGCMCSLAQGLAKGSPSTEEHLLPHPIEGITIPSLDCNGGAVNGIKSVNDNMEFICSNGEKGVVGAELCPATTAMCGMSIQYSQKYKNASNVRLRCCPVRTPLFIPVEELAFVNSFDNSNSETWRKFQFETGAYGVINVPEYKPMEAFYVSLGFSFDVMFKDIEHSLREKTDCLKSKNCIYPWQKFKFKSRHVIKVKKRLLVPPSSKVKLYQIYAQTGYFRVYTNKFVEHIRHLDSNTLYQELRVISDLDLNLTGKHPSGDSEAASSPLVAKDMSGEKENQPKILCPFHNLPASKHFQMEPPNSYIISAPVVHNLGEWSKWQNCSTEAYFTKTRNITFELKREKKIDKVGMVQLGIECGEKFKITGATDIKELDLVNPGFEKKKWKDNSWNGGVCSHGAFVGFQMQAGPKNDSDMTGTIGLRMICSCEDSDLEMAEEKMKPLINDDNKRDYDKNGGFNTEKLARSKAVKENISSNKIMLKIGGWTEEQICEPLHALQGLVLQQHPVRTDLEKYDNHGLTNVKMKCAEVPNPANTCKANEKRKLIALCENDGPVKRDCFYNVKIGVGYDSSPETHAVANALESVGYTLGCVTHSLKQNLQEKLKSPVYREPIWQSLIPVSGQLPAAPNTNSYIYQIVAECMPYKIHTNRFIKVIDGGQEEEFDLPLPDIETEAPCWKDFIEMNLEKVQQTNVSPEYMLKFHNEFTIDNFTKTSGGFILTSPTITDFGTWDHSKEWKYCPADTYIAGIAANRYQASNADHLSIAQIGFLCVHPRTGEEAEVLATKTPELPVDNIDSLMNWFNCSRKGGVAYGFQLYTQPSKEKNVDNGGTNGALIKCSGGDVAEVKFEKANQVREDGHEHQGFWSDPQTCQPKQALCGFIEQLQEFVKPEDGVRIVDNTGLSNVQVKCCDVKNPASTCYPVVKRVLVGYCDNTNYTKERSCRIELKVGVSFSPESAGTLSRNFYESIGFTKECAGKPLSKTFENGPKCLTERQDCGIDWTKVPTQTWNAEDTFKDFVSVPGSTKVPIYQVQGYCDFYVVKTNRYVVNERLLMELYLSYDDIGMGSPCWEDNVPFRAQPPRNGKLTVSPTPVHKPLQDPNNPEYDFVDDGAVLTSPVVNTTYPDETEEESWQYCNQPTYEDSWYADSVYVQREGSPNDRAGLVAIAFHCRNPKLSGEGDHVISGKTPGALILDEGVWDWKRCKCGAGVGFQISSVPAQQLGDDLAVESFKLSCSCSDPVWKRGYEFPNDLQEETGTWTKEQLCRPRQAICGLRTRSKPFKVMDNLLLWDNFGITQTKVKCCDVPNPAETCEPRQVLREIGVCENEDEDLNRRCIIDTVIGVTYDHNNEESKNLANFYESIGWGLDCVIPDLEKNIKKNMGTSSDNEGGKYRWNESNPQIWHQAGQIQDIIEIKDRTRSLVYQVVGQCGPYIVGTENFVRKDINLRNENILMEDSYQRNKPVRYEPVAHCWVHNSTFPARDYIDPSNKYNNLRYPFHGLPSPGKFVLSNLTDNGLEVGFPEPISRKNFPYGLRAECPEGKFLVGFASERMKVKDDNLGMVHYLAKCNKLSNVTRPKQSLGAEDEGNEGKENGKHGIDDKKDNGTDGTEAERNGNYELLINHPTENFEKQKLTSFYQRCIDGVLVGYQIQMNPVLPLKLNPDEQISDDVGIDNIRMMCSVGNPLDPYEKPKNDWGDKIESCRAYQALCAVSAKFGWESVGDWTQIDGTGISYIRMACCDVPSPAVEYNPSNPTNPKEILRLVAVCNNLHYELDRKCEIEFDVGVTYDFEEDPEESKMHLSIGYSIPCVLSDLKMTFQNAKNIECPTGNSCFDWKKHLYSKIFQHGLTSHKKLWSIGAHNRLDVYQTSAKFNDLLVLSNKYELVTTDLHGREIIRQKIEIPLKIFPELSEQPYCDHSVKDRKSPNISASGKLIPSNLISPTKIEGIPHSNPWSPSENIKVVDGIYVLTSFLPNILLSSINEDKLDTPRWEDWVNCPQDTFVSHISLDDGKQKGVITDFGFKCVNPDTSRLQNAISFGNEVSKNGKGELHKKPGWKSTQSMSLKKHFNFPQPTVKPSKEDEGCECGQMPFSIVIGLKITSNHKSGALRTMKPLCPCDIGGLANKTIENGKITEFLVCNNRQALCGFKVQRNPKADEISRIQAACCDIPSPVECDALEALHRAVICDNSYFDKERNCNFNLDVGVTYDFDNFLPKIKFNEAVNWKLDCMTQALADKFSNDLDQGKDTGKDWTKAAKKSPLGQEWDLMQSIPQEISVKPRSKLEVFQVVGQCDMYKTYTDRVLLTESVTESGTVRNSPKELTESDKRKTKHCWFDRQLLLGNNILVNNLKPPFGSDSYHDFEASQEGDKMYSLGDNPARTGFRLRTSGQRKSFEEDRNVDEDLIRLVLCHEGTYIKKFTGGHDNATHFMCATPNYTRPNTHSFNTFGVPQGHNYQQNTPTAFVGMVKGLNYDNMDSNDVEKTLIPSIPQKGKDDVWNDEETKGKLRNDSSAKLIYVHCHPGQAICGIQSGRKMDAICCTVENPADICNAKEKTVLSAVCDNTRGSHKRKCKVKIGVGVAYNFEKHSISSYFYTSVGYVPECLFGLKKRFQNMSCVSTGTCEYNWGSALPMVWAKMQHIPQTVEVDSYQKVVYYQKIGVCNFPGGQLFVTTPVVERKVFNKAGKQTETVEVDVTWDEEAGEERNVDECKLKFMDLSQKPLPIPLQDYSPIKLKSKFPVDNFTIPLRPFHGMPESDLYEYFSDDLVKDNSIVVPGPIDLDLELNLKPKWSKWIECTPETYVSQMEAYVFTMRKPKNEKIKLDALGINQIILNCASNLGQGVNELKLFTQRGMKSPPRKARIYKSCQGGCVAIGLEVQLREYQGPLEDDNAYVNFKQLCSCGKHAVNDFSKTATSRDHITGTWDIPQVCQPRQAICGYNFQYNTFEEAEVPRVKGRIIKLQYNSTFSLYERNLHETLKDTVPQNENVNRSTYDAFLIYDNLGITGLKAKCCDVPSPIQRCEPIEKKVLIAECDNTDVKIGYRQCHIEVDVGLSYVYQNGTKRMAEFYESIGWNLECLKDELYEKIKTKIGTSQLTKEFDWSKSKAYKMWNRAAKVIWDIPLTPKLKHSVYQVIGECGMYRIHTSVFVVSVSLNNSKDKVIVSEIGNALPDPCWAESSPIKARNWIYHIRHSLVPNFDIYYSMKDAKVIPWESEDNSLRMGYKFRTPNPPLPYFKWEHPHICPIDSYIRSFSVRRFINENADYMPQNKDLYGVVSVGYHCMYPNMSVAEEKVYTSKVFEKGEDERRKLNKQYEHHDAPGGRYQYCLGAAMGVEIEATPSSKEITDNYGILDMRFMCKTIGKDSDFAHKVYLIGININPPSIHRNAVCKVKQALCSFQGAFSKGITNATDNYAMSNLEVGCCNVPSPLETGTPQTKFVLAATCDNRAYSSPRKCQYILGIGSQYDVKNHKEASYFYMSVGYTVTCIAAQIKSKFHRLIKFHPQIFQEMAPMKVTITVEPRTKVDIYQRVGELNVIRVLTNMVQKVIFDNNLGEIRRFNYTETTNLPKIFAKKCEVEKLDLNHSVTKGK